MNIEAIYRNINLCLYIPLYNKQLRIKYIASSAYRSITMYVYTTVLTSVVFCIAGAYIAFTFSEMVIEKYLIR